MRGRYGKEDATLGQVWSLWCDTFGGNEKRRWHDGNSTAPEITVAGVISDFRLTYKEMKFKAAHRTQLEARCFAKWNSLSTRDWPVTVHDLTIMNKGPLIDNEDLTVV